MFINPQYSWVEFNLSYPQEVRWKIERSQRWSWLSVLHTCNISLFLPWGMPCLKATYGDMLLAGNDIKCPRHVLVDRFFIFIDIVQKLLYENAQTAQFKYCWSWNYLSFSLIFKDVILIRNRLVGTVSRCHMIYTRICLFFSTGLIQSGKARD